MNYVSYCMAAWALWHANAWVLNQMMAKITRRDCLEGNLFGSKIDATLKLWKEQRGGTAQYHRNCRNRWGKTKELRTRIMLMDVLPDGNPKFKQITWYFYIGLD